VIEPTGFPPDIVRRQRVDEELLLQKTYLDELFEVAPDAVVLTTLRNPRILRVNREFTRTFGYTSEEAVGSCLRDLVMPNGPEPLLPEDPYLLAGGKVEWEVIRRRKDGTWFHAHVTGKRIQLSGDEDAAYLIFRDISARKQAEALFAGEKRLLEVIAAGGPLSTTLDALCRLAEDVDRGSLVSILLLDRKAKQLHHGAGPSLPPSYCAAIDGAPVGLGMGPCAAAAHLGEQVISLDFAEDERWSDEIRALAAAHGLRTCWSTPIKSPEGRVLGTYAVYPSEPASPTPEQRSRIEQLSHLANIAIERTQSMDALRQSEERYALAMEAAADGHMDWNLATGGFHISPRMLQVVGHAPDTAFADHADWVRRFPFHPDDRPRWDAAIAAHFAGREARFRGDFRTVLNGETRWLAFNFIATRDGAGNVARWTGSIADINDARRDIATVLDTIPGLVAILTPAGEVDAVNSELVAYCGQPLEAMRQWGTTGTVHAEDLPSVAAVFTHSIAMG
jgi:PAS domain S-box-containing protein